ncbi:hypothetical protein [Roseibacillus persicicus]|uniref:hypothetical protein n=1 Tax=Roseibacillus persicicus TaxID=454148 RepID=UPI00280FCB43|nr:hypothetical protein [Roseibacillus persicicus]MDQ8190527.1 hypothetical protein [Roseibacillus persicicus]
MKKPLLQSTLLVVFSTSVGAELLFEESFNYPEGPLAGNTNNGQAWVNNVGDDTINTVAANSLEVTDPIGFLTAGGRAVQTTASSRVSLDLGSGIVPGTEGTTIYLSFIHKLNFVDVPRSQILEFWRGAQLDNNTVFSFGVDTNSAAPDYGLLIDKNAAGAVALDVGTADAEEHLVVIRIDFGAADEDTLSIYLDPGETEPASSDGTAIYTNLSFTRLGFGSFQTSSHEVDEIRIGTTYSDVVRVFVDEDNDGMNDVWESENGLLVGTNDASGDADSDDLTNLEEFLAGTDPQDEDSDDDGLTDGEEASPTMNINPYQDEVLGSAPGDLMNPLSDDSDSDGVLDEEEVKAGEDGFVTNPNYEDTDEDGMPDKWEIDEQLNPVDSSSPNGANDDPDSDNIDNLDEYTIGTQPRNPDTDGDGYNDGAEDLYGSWASVGETGTDPLNPDSDGDGLKDGEENPDSGVLGGLPHRSDPNVFDSDEDGFGDGIEVEYGSDPDDENSVPTIEPTVASIQFDFEPFPSNTGKYAGSYAPAAGEVVAPAQFFGYLGEDENFFNSLSGDGGGSLVSATGEPVPGINVDFGTLSGGIFDFDDEPSQSGGGTPANSDIYRTPLMWDWLFTRDGKALVARVNGFAAGTYRVIALVREGSEVGRTYDVSFGKQVADESQDPVLGTPYVGIAGAPATWTESQNYFTDVQTIADNEYLVVSVNPTNAAFGTLQGLQIFPEVGDIEVVSCNLVGQATFQIDFKGAPSTEYGIGSTVTLEGGFTPIDGMSATTDGSGLGQFLVTVDLDSNPRMFFQIHQE